MKPFKGPRFLIEENSIFFYLSIAFILVIAILGNYIIALVSFLVLLLAMRNSVDKYEKRKKELNKYLIEFTNNIDDMSRKTLLNFPIPLLILNKKGDIYWYNSKFKDIVGEKVDHKENVVDYFKNFPLKDLQGNKNSIDVSYGSKDYNVLFNEVEGAEDEENLYMMYWLDNTKLTTLKNLYDDEKTVICLIEIDNYDELGKDMDKMERSLISGEIEKKLDTFAKRMNGIALKYLDDRYILFFENKYLENLEAKRFDILEEVKDLKAENGDYFTLSIGIGINAKTISQLYDYAKGALDIALGRGGDQAVVKSSSNVKYYGGKSRAVEKRTKVKARMISYALRQIISQSSNVIITGHRVGDMDSFGASMGIYAIAKGMNRKAHIVLNDINPALDNIYERAKSEESEEYINSIVNTETAKKLMKEDTVVVMVDTHKPSFTEAAEIVADSEKVVMIDHHRRGEEYIENALLDYLEPYASSTSELITEIIHYMDDLVKLSKFESEALMAGIMVDTYNFTFKTGVRTFEAASYLRRAGADTVSVKKLFSDDIKVWKLKSDIINRAEIVFDDIAISHLDDLVNEGVLIASQSATELLAVKGIEASFVLVKKENEIHISGRSIGDVSVHLILEKLGGGGHLTSAGAQLEGKTIDEAKEMLKKAILKYKNDNKKKG
ncbi:MAG: DHH family phosphoesterase [Bacillota bacterium]|nr:DHH family phosphoesterase [Bacillota bacterium]